MRALITGSAGFIGSHLTGSLLEDGWDVIGVDCFNDNYARSEKLDNLQRVTEWDSFEFIPIDLARGELFDLVSDCDVVFHLAAEPGVRTSWGQRFEAYVRNNITATQHLLEALKTAPGTRLVNASSSSIYGDAETLPTSETATPSPLSPYGATKLAAEHLCRLYWANFGVEAISLRFFSVYGPRQRPDMAFTIFCRKILQGEGLVIFGDGEQTRDFTFVGDIVRALRLASSTEGVGGEVVNVGGGSQVSLNQALGLLETLSATKPDIRYEASERGDVRDTSADTTKVRSLLGFQPATRLEDGLHEQFEWAKNHA